MSLRMLRGRDGFRHSFHDDMESFFYVVLYAAVRWLAHNDVEDLGDLMTYFFNEFRESRGKAVGGTRKGQNIIDLTFVGEFVWRCAAFAEWISTVLDLQKLAYLDRVDCDAAKLSEVWEAIDAKDLPNDDRQVHPLSLPDGSTEEEELSNCSSSSLASSAHSSQRSSGSKRSAEMAELTGKTECNKRLRRSERLARRRM